MIYRVAWVAVEKKNVQEVRGEYPTFTDFVEAKRYVKTLNDTQVQGGHGPLGYGEFVVTEG